jgi:hypothetical protein
MSCKRSEVGFFKTKLCKGIMASTRGQVYEEGYRESSLLEEKGSSVFSTRKVLP